MPQRKPLVLDPVDRFVGSMIRVHRMRRGHTQESLADAINVTSLTVYRWERGERSITPRRVVQVAVVLDVNPGVFFQNAPTEFGAVVHVDTGTMEHRDTRRLLRAWDAITGNARKRYLGLGLTLAQACRERADLRRLKHAAGENVAPETDDDAE